MSQLRPFGGDFMYRAESTLPYTMHYTSGESLLDLQAGNSAYLFGYNNKYIIDAISEATQYLSFVRGNRGETTQDAIVAGQHLIESGGFHSMSWAVSGSSAVEAAIQMATYYNDRQTIIALTPAYHGTTRFCKALSNMLHDPNVEYIEKQSEEYILHNLRNKCKTGKVLAFIFETCSWLTGVHEFSTEFWQSVRDICNQYDTLMITDDVAMCWFRYTDQYHGWKKHGVQPDITAVGKALSGGYFPIGAAACTKKVAKKIGGNWMFGHTWHPSMGGIAAMKATRQLLEDGGWLRHLTHSNLYDNNPGFESLCRRFRQIAENLKDNGVVTGYRQAGLFMTLDTPFTYTPQCFINAGLLINQVPMQEGSLKVIGSLCVDDNYFEMLEERLWDLFMSKM